MYDGELSEVAHKSQLSAVSRVRLALVRESDPTFEPTSCRHPANAARLIHPLLEGEPQEVVGALLLDGRHHAVGYTLPYRGTPSKALVEIRGLFVPALLTNASSIIVLHNHPSDDPTPSREDPELTSQLVEAGRILGIRLLDHLERRELGSVRSGAYRRRPADEIAGLPAAPPGTKYLACPRCRHLAFDGIHGSRAVR